MKVTHSLRKAQLVAHFQYDTSSRAVADLTANLKLGDIAVDYSVKRDKAK